MTVSEPDQLNRHKKKFDQPPAKLYHATTEHQHHQYQQTGHITAPVRAFDTDRAAMVWAMQTNRQIILRIDTTGMRLAMMPDHHNTYGAAWWTPDDVPLTACQCVVQPDQPQRRADDQQ